MVRQREVIPLGWGDTEVPLHSYVAFYHTNDGSVRRSLGFLRTGLDESGTFCMFLAEQARIPGFLSQLQEGYDGDVGACVESGKLVAAPWHPNFEGLADALMGRIEHALSGGEYVRVRAMGLVAWAAVGWGDAAWLKRCESRINLATSMYPMVILCTYSLPDLPGLVATGLDPEHPQIVVNDAMGTVTSSVAKAAMTMSRRFGRRRAGPG